MDFVSELGLWISAFFMLCVYSWMYKYNKLFRFAEHTLVGSASGYFLVLGINNISNIAIGGLGKGNISMIIPILIGVSLYTRYIGEFSWVSKYGISFMVAVSSTIAFRALIETQVTQQIAAAIKNFDLSSSLSATNSIIIMGFTICTMLYFIFTTKLSEDVPGYKLINTIGRYGILTIVGYYLGITTMTRLSFVINRLEFLLFEWLRISRF